MQLTIEIDAELLRQAKEKTAIHDDAELIAFALRFMDPRMVAQAQLGTMFGKLRWQDPEEPRSATED